ncbi:MAG: error-prone DNA polymerase [Rhodospirillales bacterium]|jgi:error-prone DNA polymerase|nr:error-prone DNA polymerase [Rhodospirillales bacterium]
MTAYAELQASSNFSFLRGASHPEELVARAAELGHGAIAIADRNTLAGVVRAHTAAKAAGIKLVIGSRLDFTDGAPSLLLFPTDRTAYGRLSRLLTLGKRRAAKGACALTLDDVIEGEVFARGAGQMAIAVPPRVPDAAFATTLGRLRDAFGRRLSLAAQHLCRGDDARRLAALADLAESRRVPLVATNDVHAHIPERRPLHDALTCIREHCTIFEAGFRLAANAERHLKPATEMARLFRAHPAALARTMEIAGACAFSLDELRYEYPVDPVPGGRTPQDELTRLAHAGAAERYPKGVPTKITAQIAHELALIGQLGYAPYFLTVHDIVRFAQGRGILCQGRGSAANSAVCYCLGITAVDPNRIDLLFERFVSAERDEPPDIDVDFEHERREEVIQYVYGKYGRERAGMTATTITYRTKSAIREVGKAMGLSEDAILALQGASWRRAREDVTDARVREAGLDPDARTVRLTRALVAELVGFPRHLSQHTGGMVMTRGPLCEMVPIENAAMKDRTVIEWNKDDLDQLGILKIDILGLGMLTCVRKAFALLARHHDRPLALATVPAEDAAVYEMLCRADSVGVFQVESRAQMSMLPRLKPRNFYDLVIEVAIVRPGPIQGDMVHHYLRRRAGIEAVNYPSEDLRQVLDKTLGVPLFQEQAMKIAIVAAGFTPAEADGLRRAMASFRRFGHIHGFETRFIDGMLARGYARDFAERCFKQIEGFSDYGFPESHAASFALLVYVSAWLKCHYPHVFACALLNSQPMGFYAPAQIVRDLREHGAEVRPVDVNASDWDCTLEPGEGGMALRLGLRQVKGLTRDAAETIVRARGAGYPALAQLWRRTGLGKAALATLARADAFASLGLGRRQALWGVHGLNEDALPLFDRGGGGQIAHEPAVVLPPMALGEEVAEDYRAVRLSLRRHPMAFLRDDLGSRGYTRAAELAHIPHGRSVKVAGLVTARQRPGSANGVIFATIEDETGVANLIVWPAVFEKFRKAVLGASVLGVAGRVQREGIVIHVLAEKVLDLTALLGRLDDGAPVPAPAKARTSLRLASRDFH